MADGTGRIPCSQKHVHTLLMGHTANFDRNGVGTYGAYHHKSELKRCNRVKKIFLSAKICGSYRDFRTGKLNANGQ